MLYIVFVLINCRFDVNKKIMKYWKLLGYESEPKGIGKIVSISLFIVLLNGYILEGFIDHYLLDIITWTCVVVFMVTFFIQIVNNFIRK